MTRYGILGFGNHAAKRLSKGFREAQHSELTGLWRRDQQKASENARTFSIPHIFETPEALCASEDIDAVFVVSPDAIHLPHVLLAATHGKAVLCEKPLAMSVAEAEQMLAATRQSGVKCGVAQNMRYNRSLQLMCEWIAHGKIGSPLLSQAQFVYNVSTSPRAWIYNPTVARGGPIGDVGIHCLDALRFVLGTDITDVSTLAHTDAHSGAVESHAAISVAFSTGAMGSVSVTSRGSYRSLVEVVGELGVLSCENAMTVDHPVDVVLRRGGQVVESVTVSNEDAFSRMIDGFSTWVKGGETYLAPVEDGLLNQRVLDAAYASWQDGRSHRIG